MTSSLSPGGQAILAVLSDMGATLLFDGAALTVEAFPGQIGRTFERYIWLHADELSVYAKPCDPWTDPDAPAEPCPECAGTTFHRAGDTGEWTCVSCAPRADTLSWIRAVAATPTTAIPRAVRPWETSEWENRVKRAPPHERLKGRIPRSTTPASWRRET